MSEWSIDLTQAVGVAVFAIAAAACLAAAGRRPVPWRMLAALQVLFGTEVVTGIRYRLHNAVDFVLQAHGRYEGRQPLQLALVGLVLVLAAACVTAIGLRGRRLGEGLTGALVGTALTATLFGIETVSLHGVDAVLYAMTGPIRAIGWLWVGGAAITTAAALRGAGESARKR